MFRIAEDPGVLLNGNTLCGDDATYVAFFEDKLPGAGRLLQLVVFEGEDVPEDVNSPGHCATFNYGIE